MYLCICILVYLYIGSEYRDIGILGYRDIGISEYRNICIIVNVYVYVHVYVDVYVYIYVYAYIGLFILSDCIEVLSAGRVFDISPSCLWVKGPPDRRRACLDGR